MTHAHDASGHPHWQPGPPGDRDPRARARRRERHGYVVGLVLALVLTAVPFALVDAHAMLRPALMVAIGAFAFVQAIVHFRFFLHVEPPHRNTDEFLLILFSALILVMMAGGTIWVLSDLAARMY